MSDDLYERYKEALRTGHVAVLRGALDEALAAYKLAAETAPSRALPHTSLGGVYIRLGRLDEALTEFAAAVARSPHDEGALLGQAEALTAAGMRNDAAAALDHVAEIQEAAGRLPEAADTLRRAVELEEAPDRIRRQRALLREIRFAAGDHAAEQLLARALRLREEPGAAPRPAAGATQTTGAGAAALPASQHDDTPEPPYIVARAFEPARVQPEPAAAMAAPEPIAEASHFESEQAPGETPAVEIAAAATSEPEPEAQRVAAAAQPVDRPSAERPAVGVMDGVDGPPLVPAIAGSRASESEHQPTGDELLAAAEAADLAGDNTALRSLLVWTARAYAREGRFEAGLDATHRLLQRYPGDVDAHLVLVELYVARSWDGLAADKLRLLGRLADLDKDQEAKARIGAAATRAFPNDPSMQELCS
jgi:tetratricopeptide (TPR) repeat protein